MAIVEGKRREWREGYIQRRSRELGGVRGAFMVGRVVRGFNRMVPEEEEKLREVPTGFPQEEEDHLHICPLKFLPLALR